jgi:hypothetical protein
MLDKTSRKEWDSALCKAGANGTIFQSTYWADCLREIFGDRPIYFASFDKRGEIRGLLLAIESCYAAHPLATLSGKRGQLLGGTYKHVLSPLFHKLAPFTFWENGPIILSGTLKETSARALYREIINETIVCAQKRGCYEIKFARPAFFWDDDALWSSFGFQGSRMGTILIDVEDPVEVLWMRIDYTARRNIKKNEADLSIIEISSPEQLADFYEMHVHSTRRTGMKQYPFSFFRSLWRSLSPSGRMVGFIAYFGDKPVGGSISLAYNRIVHEYAHGDSDYARRNKIYPLDCLKWHTIKWAHECNLKYFDLSGVELHKIDAGDEKARNIYRFKSKWGGKLVEYHDYTMKLQDKRLVRFLSRFIVDSIIHN